MSTNIIKAQRGKKAGKEIIISPEGEPIKGEEIKESAILEAIKKLDLAEMYARRFTKEAIDTIREIMINPGVKHQTRLNAAMAILARGWGNPAIAIRDITPRDDKSAKEKLEEELNMAQKAAEELMERASRGFSQPYLEVDVGGEEIIDSEFSVS